jgi:hypothetical protein
VIEGFISPTAIGPGVKLLIGASLFVVFAAYLLRAAPEPDATPDFAP